MACCRFKSSDCTQGQTERNIYRGLFRLVVNSREIFQAQRDGCHLSCPLTRFQSVQQASQIARADSHPIH
eukprot:scaffold424418_cov34-Prasinocladus_malaysianus.AAC.1